MARPLQEPRVVPLVGGPTAVSRVEAELWREANAEGGGFLSTAVTTDDGEVVHADRIKLMAWCAPPSCQQQPSALGLGCLGLGSV